MSLSLEMATALCAGASRVAAKKNALSLEIRSMGDELCL